MARALLAALVVAVTVGMVVLGRGEPPGARAANTLTWVGGNNGTWSNAQNWSPAKTPVDGDTLVFGPLAAFEMTENDLGNLSLAEVRVQSADNVAIVGDGFEAVQISADDGTLEILVPLDLSSNLAVETLGPGDRITVRGPAGSLDTNGFDVELLAGSEGTFAVDGTFEGMGSVTIRGGMFELDRPSNFSGFVRVEEGELRYSFVSAPPCGSSPAANVTVGAEGRIRALCAAAVASLNSSGAVLLGERSPTSAGELVILSGEANIITGKLDFGERGTLHCCAPGGLLTVSAAVFGAQGIAVVEQGTWAIAESSFPPTVTFQVIDDGVLEGRGSAGAGFSFGGTVSPGGPGTTAILRAYEWRFATGSTYRVDVIGTAFDRFVLNSDLVIEPNVMLDLHVSGAAPAGTVVTVARSGTAITGTFSGLPEGTRFPAGGQLWEISYAANDGTDVTLTRVEEGQPAMTPRARIPMVGRD